MSTRVIVPSVIRMDPSGSGRFHSSRGGGKRKHVGVDYICEPGGVVFSDVEGTVSRLGWAYSDDPQWRYIEILTDGLFRHRFFYVEPLVALHDHIRVGDVIGEAQDITLRYPNDKMTPHIHYEILDQNGRHVNPETYTNGSVASYTA